MAMNELPSDDEERRAWRVDAEWARLHQRVEAIAVDPPAPRVWRRLITAAVAASVVIGTAIVWQRSPGLHASRDALEWRVATTPPAGRATVRLSDNSVVTLGPSTTLRYAVTRARREVVIEGMANFSVVHDESRPFVVRADNAVATDIGTEFVVRNYATDSAVTVAVTSGAVSLSAARGQSSSDGSPAVLLRAGAVGRVQRDGIPRLNPAADALTASAWMNEKLIFQNATLAEVAVELGRWFDVTVSIEDATLASRRITAVYSAPSLDGVLDALSTTVHARYTRRGTAISIAPSGK